MSASLDLYQRSLTERIFHALLFEGLAIAICAPMLAWILNQPLHHLGLFTVYCATIAMLWNMLFNFLFDRAQRRMQFERTLWVRVLHASLFEFGLILVLVPLAAWWLKLSLWDAFLVDLGLILFFLPYAVVYNWGYDKIRLHLMQRTARAQKA